MVRVSWLWFCIAVPLFATGCPSSIPVDPIDAGPPITDAEADAAPSETDASRDAGSDDGSITDGGDGGECSGPRVGPCDVTIPASCGAGMACRMVGSTSAGWMTTCAPAGDRGQAERCDPAMTGQCQAGLQCFDGRCKTLCCSSSACDAGVFCQQIGAADVGLCQPDLGCDLILQRGCETFPGTACYPSVGGGSDCVAAGTLAEGEPCRVPNECLPGSGCFSTPGGEGFCRAYCDDAFPEPCPMGFDCREVPGLPLFYGQCLPSGG